MKTKAFLTWSLGLALAALPLGGGCDQESANSTPAISSDTNQESAADPAAMANAPSPDAAEQQLEDAPGQVVSTATPSPPNASLTGPAIEVAKLAQAGVDESVMLSFVTNSPHTFNLSSDAIIYLNDIGVPGTVVTSMIQHDRNVKGTSPYSAAASTPPVYSNQLAPAPGTAMPYPAPNSAPDTTESPAPLPAAPNYSQPPPEVNVSYPFFYDSLAPYGNWIDIGGYGLCWQPTVVGVNRGWQPYCNNGHWVYSDCGWYWVSDFSWGWAPFHYGRWFRHSRWGWCWAPDTVWGPAWVSWRFTRDVCGWAPLPPTACFTVGIGPTFWGRRVHSDFPFGLGARDFVCVPLNHFHDRHWHDHLMPEHQVKEFFAHSAVANPVARDRTTFINEGVPVSRVVATTHTEIPRLHIRDAAGPASGRFERVERDGRSLTVHRLNAPMPAQENRLVGQGIRPDLRNYPILRPSAAPAANTARQNPGTVVSIPGARWADAVPIFRNQPSTPAPAQNPVARQNPGVFRQETPKFTRQDEREFVRPTAPVQRQPDIRTYPSPRAADSREPQRSYNNAAPERTAPSFRSEPMTPAGPRVEARQASPVQTAPPPQRNNSSASASRGSQQDNNSRQNR